MSVSTETTYTVSIGDQLRDARIKAKRSVDDLVRETKISRQYLEAIETNQFESIPYAEIYIKNFLKKYTSALGCDSSQILDQYNATVLTAAKENQDTSVKKARTSHYHLLFPNLPLLIRGLIIVSLVLVVVTYLVTQVNAMVAPPPLEIDSPRDGLVTTESSLVINGQTEKEVRIFINDEEIYTSETGQYSESVILSDGINRLQIEARTKHGKITKRVRYVTYSPEE